MRDFAEVRANGVISGSVAAQALDMLNVDAEGFDYMDRKLLLAIIDKFTGGPVGLDNGGGDRRRARNHRGRDRAVPDPAGLYPAHAARPLATQHAYRHFGLEREA